MQEAVMTRLYHIFLLHNRHAEIGLGKIFNPVQPIKKLAQERQQVLILDGQIFKSLIINIYTKSAITLLNKKNQRSCKIFGTSYEIVGYVDFHVHF